MAGDEVAHLRRGHRGEALEVVPEPAGVAEMVLVLVQAVRDAAEAAELLEARHDARGDLVLGALELLGGRTRRGEAVELGVDRGLELLDRCDPASRWR